MVVILTAIISGRLGDTIRVGGTGKAFLSFISYIPQIYLIFRNKSSFGWSIPGVYMDISGASLAIIQIVIDHYRINNEIGFWSHLNWGKFLLNLFSAGCCCVMLFQHFVLYRGNVAEHRYNDKMPLKEKLCEIGEDDTNC